MAPHGKDGQKDGDPPSKYTSESKDTRFFGDLFEFPEGSKEENAGCCLKASQYIAWTIMICVVLQEVAALAQSLFFSWDKVEGLTAMALVRVANDWAGLMIAIGLLVAWHALCHRSSKMRHYMNKKQFFFPKGIMAGGFLPIPAMVSVSLLMFVTNTVVNTGVVRGDWLLVESAGMEVWVPDKRCRWTAVEDSTWLTEWFSRFHRRAAGASVTSAVYEMIGIRDKTTYTCFMGGGTAETGPKDFPMTAVLNKAGSKDLPIPNVINPMLQNGTTLPDLKCMYQCAGWSVLTLQSLITQAGQIGAGSALVVVVTAWLGQKIGTRLIREDTSPEQMERLHMNHKSRAGFCKFCERSSLLCAIKLCLIYAFLKWFLVFKVDADGPNTVDYYVTFGTLFAATVVVLIRAQHPFYNRSLLYTADVWNNGKDTFYIPALGAAHRRGQGRSDVVGTDDGAMITKLLDGKSRDNFLNETEILRKNSKDLKDDVLLTTLRYLVKKMPPGSKKTVKDWLKEDGHSQLNEHLWSINLDLLQWMHMKPQIRWKILLDYVRRVDAGTPGNAPLTILGDQITAARVDAICGHWKEKGGDNGTVKLEWRATQTKHELHFCELDGNGQPREGALSGQTYKPANLKFKTLNGPNAAIVGIGGGEMGGGFIEIECSYILECQDWEDALPRIQTLPGTKHAEGREYETDLHEPLLNVA